MQAAMSIETLLQAVASSGNGLDSILAIQCSLLSFRNPFGVSVGVV